VGIYGDGTTRGMTRQQGGTTTILANEPHDDRNNDTRRVLSFPRKFFLFSSFFLIQLIVLHFLGKNSTSYAENGHPDPNQRYAARIVVWGM
jgi:hypothetical protein